MKESDKIAEVIRKEVDESEQAVKDLQVETKEQIESRIEHNDGAMVIKLIWDLSDGGEENKEIDVFIGKIHYIY